MFNRVTRKSKYIFFDLHNISKLLSRFIYNSIYGNYFHRCGYFVENNVKLMASITQNTHDVDMNDTAKICHKHDRDRPKLKRVSVRLTSSNNGERGLRALCSEVRDSRYLAPTEPSECFNELCISVFVYLYINITCMNVKCVC